MQRTAVAAFVAAGLAATAAGADTGIVAVYEATPEQIWEMVDFHQPSENVMPPIASSERTGEGIGATKVNTLADGGGKVDLLLVYYNPDAHAFNYTIQDSPLPVENYVGQVRVEDAGEGRAKLTWHGTYDPAGVEEAQADEILGGFYGSIADRIGETYTRVE